jgi:pimeloyl-ACP methyl ester carboxylesterase
MVVDMYTGLRRPLYELLARILGGAVVRSPAAREDFVVSAEASLNHDPTGRLEAIGARALVVGGAQDRLFPLLSRAPRRSASPQRRCGSSRGSDTGPSTSVSATSTRP